jgi:hypothetical protein
VDSALAERLVGSSILGDDAANNHHEQSPLPDSEVIDDGKPNYSPDSVFSGQKGTKF